MEQPLDVQLCQWWEALLAQAVPQAWVCWAGGVGGVVEPVSLVQMASRVTSWSGIWKRRSGRVRSASESARVLEASQAAKV